MRKVTDAVVRNMCPKQKNPLGLKTSRCAHEADATRKAIVAASLPEWGSTCGSDDDEDCNADDDKLEEAVNMDYNWESLFVSYERV